MILRRTETPRETFHSLEASSKSADRENHPGHRFALAGLNVRLHSPTEQLADLFYRAFSHLPVVPQRSNGADIDIEIITGASRPLLGAAAEAGFHSDVGRHRFQASPDGRFVCHEVLESGSLWCLDRQTSRVIGWIESAERITLYERAKPLANLLPLMVEPFGLYMFHSALVSWRGHGVLFVGAGGSGKSTSALSCLQGGFDFVAEDLVVLEETSAGFIGHGVYNSAWIEPDHMSKFGDLGQYAYTGGEVEQRKSVLMLAEIEPGRMRSSAPLTCMMLPRIRPNERSAVHEVGRPEALKQLAPNCLMTASRIDKKGFDALVRLVKASRCYRLNLGDDLERVPSLVRDAVESDA